MGRDLSRRAVEEEQMDAPDLDPAIYAAVLADLSRVNIATLAARPTLAFLKRLRPRMERLGRPVRVLDVGFGSGDMLRAIARRLDHWRVPATLVGIDLNPMSAPVAAATTPSGMDVDWRTGDCAALAGTGAGAGAGAGAGEGWDIILSSLVLHHMTDDQRADFLRFMETEAALGWFINDLHRHAFAYHGFPLLARLLGVHRIVREDGQLSIARAFRPAEWQAILAGAGLDDAARVERIFPFRLCVARLK